jgi:ribonuclease G
MESAEEPIVLPGESLAKYRGKPASSSAPPPIAEHEANDKRPDAEETTQRTAITAPASGPGAGGVPRRFSGGLPRWVLAEASPEAEAAPAGEPAVAKEEVPAAESKVAEGTPVRSDAELDEDQVVALASGVVEAKHEETQEGAEADSVVGGAEFEEEETEEEAEEAEEIPSAPVSELSEEEAAEVEAGRAASRADFAADAAQETAEHAAALGEPEEAEHERVVIEHGEEEVIGASTGESVAEAALIEDEVILLPGETRAPRTGGPGAPRDDFPRDSARGSSGLIAAADATAAAPAVPIIVAVVRGSNAAALADRGTTAAITAATPVRRAAPSSFLKC